MSLRVAMVTPEHPGCGPSYGVGAYVATLAGSLRAAGCPTLVLVAGDEGLWRIENDSSPSRCGRGGLPFAVRPLARADWLRSQLRAWRPEVVESANWGGLGALLRGRWLRVVRLSTPTLVIPRSGRTARLARPLHHAWEARAVREAAVVIADSAAMARLGLRVYGRASDAIVAHAWAGAIADEPATGDDVLFVGRLEPRKGVDVLLAAWAAIRARHPARRLHLVGSDPTGWGGRMLARHGAAQIAVHGRIDDAELASLRRRCGIQAVPSRFESFGIVVLEAWAAGLAVVASPAGALAEVVGTAGLIAPSGDAAALAGTLERLLGDVGLCRHLASAGRRRLLAAHAPATLATATLAAYAGQGIRGRIVAGHTGTA